jgi:hypothetical protein
MYHCAQSSSRQEKSQKSQKDSARHRDKGSMDVFECKGWLHITLNDWDHIAYVKMEHLDEHVPYWSIDVPDAIKQMIIDLPDLTPVQVCLP